jgi:DNA-binding ferritin-like protein (Dps family)
MANTSTDRARSRRLANGIRKFMANPATIAAFDEMHAKAGVVPDDLRTDWQTIAEYLRSRGHKVNDLDSVEAVYDLFRRQLDIDRIGHAVTRHVAGETPKTERKANKWTETKNKATELFIDLRKTMKDQIALNRVNEKLHTDYSLSTLRKYAGQLVG